MIDTQQNKEYMDSYSNSNFLQQIQSFLHSNKGNIHRTLQIGLHDGVLANTIIDGTQKLHIVVDPKQELFDFLGIKLLKSTGNWKLVDYRDDFSYAVLPKLLEGNVLPELIIIDGDLRFDYLMADFLYSDLILKKRCYLLVRKNYLESTQSFHQYLQKNRLEFVIVESFEDYILYQKIARDNRDEHFFVQYWL